MARQRRSKSKGTHRPDPAPTPALVAVPVASPGARFRAVLFLAFGLVAFLVLPGGVGVGWARWVGIIAAGALATLPPGARLVNDVLDRLRNPTSRGRAVSALLIWLVVTAYLVLTAFAQDRIPYLFPKTHDECSYFLGVQMLARGRLWMPAHPLGDFFESFYVLQRPVYASIYFPGTALLFAPTVWLNGPSWLLPACVGGGAAAALYLVIGELIDGAAGVVAVVVLVSLTWFRTLAMMVMSQVPMLLLGLLLVWAWLRWRKKPSWGWALVVGALAGWGAITRPVDALVFAVPVGIAMLLDLRRKPVRAWLGAAGFVAAGATPFLLLQLVFDYGVTGHVLQTPYTVYLREQQPGATFGFHRFDPAELPKSALPQVRKDYALSRTYFARHQPGNFWRAWLFTQHPEGFADRPGYLAMIADVTLPARVLLVLVPVGLLGLRGRGRGVLAWTIPLFVVLYILNPYFLEHYAIPLIPAVVMLVLLGVESMVGAWPRYGGRIRAGVIAVVVASALTATYEINQLLVSDPRQQVSDEPLRSEYLRLAHEIHGQRAVVLFRWDPAKNWKEEPVCNSEVAWPDDAEVVRAHHLGPRNAEIVEYYGRTQPDRVFFVWDQKADKLSRVAPGATAGDLRRALIEGRKIDSLLRP